MEYLYLIWYIIALAFVGGSLIWYLRKKNMTIGNKRFKQDIRAAYGKVGYWLCKILGWIIFIYALFWLIGRIVMGLL